MTIVKKVFNKIANLAIESGVTGYLPARGSRIIMYHGIDQNESKLFNSRFIGIKSFEKQIRFFKNNYNIVSLSDYFEKKFDRNRFTIAITFDDGYQNNFTYALPILEKYEVPASFYITGLNNTESKIIWSDFVDIASYYIDSNMQIDIDGKLFHKRNNRKWYTSGNESLYDLIKRNDFSFKQKVEVAFLSKMPDFRDQPELNDYWKIMTDEEIKQMSKSKFASIGSHGFYHNNLGLIPQESAYKEILCSKEYLENLIQRPVTSIAYPDGSYNPEVVEGAYKMGIKEQLAVNYLFQENDDNNIIKSRLGIYPFQSVNKLGDMIARQKK